MPATPTGKQARYIGLLSLAASVVLLIIGLFSDWQGLNFACTVLGALLIIPSLVMLLIYGRDAI